MENTFILSHYAEKPAIVSYRVSCEYTEKDLLAILNKEVTNSDEAWRGEDLVNPEHQVDIRSQINEYLSSLHHNVDEIAILPDYDPYDHEENTTISKVVGPHRQWYQSHIFYK